MNFNFAKPTNKKDLMHFKFKLAVSMFENQNVKIFV